MPAAAARLCLGSRHGSLAPFLGRDRRNGACLHKLHPNTQPARTPFACISNVHVTHSLQATLYQIFGIRHSVLNYSPSPTETRFSRDNAVFLHLQSLKSAVSRHFTCKLMWLCIVESGEDVFTCALYALCGEYACGHVPPCPTHHHQSSRNIQWWRWSSFYSLTSIDWNTRCNPKSTLFATPI